MHCSIVILAVLAILVIAEELKNGYPATLDLDDQGYRQVVVDREAGQYLGHPTTCLLDDGRTILCV